MNKLSLVKQGNFGNVQCDFYQNRNNEFLMTREQIGAALGYENPTDAIYRIHERHKERLDKFSVIDKLNGTDGKRYETYLYTAKGVYEICRWSRQTKADQFYDYVYEILEQLRTGKVTTEICKQIRRELTDLIKDSGLDSEMHGWGFKTITDLTYKLTTGKNAQQLRKDYGVPPKTNIRPLLPEDKKVTIAKLEQAIKALLEVGYTYTEIKLMLSDKVKKLTA